MLSMQHLSQINTTRSHAVKNGPSGFECDHWVEPSADTLRVYLRGQLVYETLAATESCWQAVRAAVKRFVVLDLSQVTFMGSAALGSLCGLRRWLESRGCSLRIAAVSTEVRVIMEVSGMLGLFAVNDDSGETGKWSGPEGGRSVEAWAHSVAGQLGEVVAR
jgi:anti-anti-sigma factor